MEIPIRAKAQALIIPPEALQQNDVGGGHVWFREAPDQAPHEMPVRVEGVWPQGLEVSGLRAGYVQLP
nr:hypothetical protein [uncultured Pseudomonas sp.]